MWADRLLLVLRTLALKRLMFSCFTVVDIIVDSVAISNLIVTKCHDACVGSLLLACNECLIECKNTLDLEAFGPFAPEFCSGNPLVHFP